MEEVWKKLDKIHPVRYQFYDQLVEEYYSYFRDFINIVGLTAALAVLIACLGLLGMATYTVETKIKEIGIRKVFGASIVSLVMMLSKAFLKLISIAILIGVPMAWFLNDIWLQGFAYRIDQGIVTFFDRNFDDIITSLYY